MRLFLKAEITDCINYSFRLMIFRNFKDGFSSLWLKPKLSNKLKKMDRQEKEEIEEKALSNQAIEFLLRTIFFNT